MKVLCLLKSWTFHYHPTRLVDFLLVTMPDGEYMQARLNFSRRWRMLSLGCGTSKPPAKTSRRRLLRTSLGQEESPSIFKRGYVMPTMPDGRSLHVMELRFLHVASLNIGIGRYSALASSTSSGYAPKLEFALA